MALDRSNRKLLKAVVILWLGLLIVSAAGARLWSDRGAARATFLRCWVKAAAVELTKAVETAFGTEHK